MSTNKEDREAEVRLAREKHEDNETIHHDAKTEKKRRKYEAKIARKKEREAAGKKNVFVEFKEFISRGNIIDMAVGVIIAGAFTAIVTALVQKVFMPIINWLVGGSVDGIVTILPEKDGAFCQVGVDPAGLVRTCAYVIEWSALINAIISFILIALILFVILKIVRSIGKARKKAQEAYERKQMIDAGIDPDKKEEAPEPEPVATNTDLLNVLMEIRNELKSKDVKANIFVEHDKKALKATKAKPADKKAAKK